MWLQELKSLSTNTSLRTDRVDAPDYRWRVLPVEVR